MRPALFILLIFLSMSSPAWALYATQRDDSDIDISGMMQVYGIGYKRPANPLLYRDNDRYGIAGIGRIMIKGQSGDSLSFEANAYQTYIPTEFTSGQSGSVAIPDVERSSALEWSFSDAGYVHAAVDRLNLRWSKDRLDIILGRQPVNLATTFYFTPNDFFAPFAAQTFYRVYKPGVDALRAEVRLGDLSQLSLISVLGYHPDMESDTGWGRRPDAGRTSYLGRVSTNLHNFEWAFIAGTLADSDVVGGSLQGELFKWLGVRAEGHMAYPDAKDLEMHGEFSMGIEHHWENSLDLRLEYFYHGAGSPGASGYSSAAMQNTGRGLYLGRNYSALGIGYEFTPLLTGQTAFIRNLSDRSLLASFNAIYSISNAAELSIGFTAPFGRKAEGLALKSEFGMYPYSFNMEWRWYF